MVRKGVDKDYKQPLQGLKRISASFVSSFCRCMVEAGYDYSTDSLPDPAVWEQMLNKSPIKHIKQVWVFLVYRCPVT